MSMDRCFHCCELIDTDDFPDAYLPHYADRCVCESCQENRYELCEQCELVWRAETMVDHVCEECRNVQDEGTVGGASA